MFIAIIHSWFSCLCFLLFGWHFWMAHNSVDSSSHPFAGLHFQESHRGRELMCRSSESLQHVCQCIQVWHTPEIWGLLSWLSNWNIVIPDTRPAAHRMENYLDARILIEFQNSLKNSIQPSLQTIWAHEIKKGQDSYYLLMLSVVARNFSQYSHNLANPTSLYDH